MIKLFDPHVSLDEVEAAKEVLLSHNWASGTGGGKVKEFEEELGDYIHALDIVAVNSGTAALDLALRIAGVEGKNVLVPSLTFVSTAHAAKYNNANPVFVDVDVQTLCMDSADLERKMKIGDIGAIVPVHFGGMTCNMKEIAEIAEKNDVMVVDDAAHACGAGYDNGKVGSTKDLTCFSFHPVKNLSMPTGGAIAINNTEKASEWRKRLNSLRWCGIDNREGTSYDVTSVATNYYMSEISAAIGLVQLKKLDLLNKRRRAIAKRYSSELRIERKMPFVENCAYHLYWILSDKRSDLIRYLNSKGIEVGTHYRPIHTMSAYRNNQAHVPVTDQVGTQVVTIPIHPNLSDEDVTHVIESINSFVERRE